jgi:hypothetical protein
MGLIYSIFGGSSSSSGTIFTYDNLCKLIVFLAPFIIVGVKSFGNIFALIVALLLGFGLSFGLLWEKCQRTSGKTPNYSKIATYSIPLTICYGCYVIAIMLSPIFAKTPVTMIISRVVNSVLGAIGVGLIAAFAVMWPVLSLGDFCDSTNTTTT